MNGGFLLGKFDSAVAKKKEYIVVGGAQTCTSKVSIK